MFRILGISNERYRFYFAKIYTMMDSPTPISADENPTPPSDHRHLWLFLLAFLACVMTYLLIAVWDMPLAGAWIGISIFGWMLAYLARLNCWGVMLLCLTAMGLCANIQEMVSPFIQKSVYLQYLHFLIGFFGLSSLLVFSIAAVKNPQKRGRNIGGALLVFFTFGIGGIEHSFIRDYLNYQEAIQHTEQTIIELHLLGNEVESFRSKFNRVPSDEAEFVRFRGQPMPPYRGKYCYSYQAMGDDEYNLSCCISDFWGRHWDLFGYILMYYGPRSTERIHAVLF